MRISDWSSDVCSSDLRLDRALQWPRTVHRIEAGLGELVERGIAERQRDAAFDKAPDEALRLDAGDRTDLCRTEWVKDHRLVDTIDELGKEVLTDHRPNKESGESGKREGERVDIG